MLATQQLEHVRLFVDLYGAQTESQIKEIVCVYFEKHAIPLDLFPSTIEYILTYHMDKSVRNITKSLKSVVNELSYNFCPICLTYQCVTHLQPNANSDWPLSTPKRPLLI
jgi:hypothetical protein